MLPHEWALRTAQELGAFTDDKTSSTNLARCYLDLRAKYAEVLRVAHELGECATRMDALKPFEVGTKKAALEQMVVDAINAGVNEASRFA